MGKRERGEVTDWDVKQLSDSPDKLRKSFEQIAFIYNKTQMFWGEDNAIVSSLPIHEKARNRGFNLEAEEKELKNLEQFEL